MSTMKIAIILYILGTSVAGLFTPPRSRSSMIGSNDSASDTSEIFQSSTDNVYTKKLFPCETYSIPNRNISVHSLTPMDIGVVAAMGDSITAAFGVTAKTLGEMRDDRGMSFSIGGDGTILEIITLPNILRKYNPNLKGFSVGYGFQTENNAHLNMAITSATSMTTPIQAKELIHRMKYGPENIDYENEWKIITIFIGGNDLCEICYQPEEYNENIYLSNIRNALDILHQEVPKAFVNLILLADLTQYHELDSYLHTCNLVHTFLCRCVHDASTEVRKNEIKMFLKNTDESLWNLVESGRYDTRDDFTVVIQPFLKNFHFPRTSDNKVDMKYFAVDCFHLSKTGHEMGATSLWANMLQPVGSKDTDTSFDFLCPSSDKPYFGTRKNSVYHDIATRPYPITTQNIPSEREPQHKNVNLLILRVISTGFGVILCFYVFSLSINYICRRKDIAESPLLLENKV